MSCRRSDHARLVGCKIGDFGVRGCDRGCCWYPDSEIEANSRHHFLTSHNPSMHNPPAAPHTADRTGLYYAHCLSSHRPKFICAKPTCRRSVKPFYDPAHHEYRIDAFQNWSIRPLASQNSELAAAFCADKRISMRDTPEKRALTAIKRRYFDDPTSISGEELATLKAEDPEMWWTDLVLSGVPDAQLPASHNIHCPSCGDRVVRVGSTFEIPPQRDDKSWRNIERMIASGEDMVAKFSSCATVEEHKDMVEEALRLRARERGAGAWNEEKRRRIAALGLAGDGNHVQHPSPSESCWDVVSQKSIMTT